MESANKSVDMDYLKQKVEAGCDFVTTQMFFDNSVLYSYLYRIREKGITVPVIAGIMPVTNASPDKAHHPDVGNLSALPLYVPGGQIRRQARSHEAGRDRLCHRSDH